MPNSIPKTGADPLRGIRMPLFTYLGCVTSRNGWVKTCQNHGTLVKPKIGEGLIQTEVGIEATALGTYAEEKPLEYEWIWPTNTAIAIKTWVSCGLGDRSTPQKVSGTTIPSTSPSFEWNIHNGQIKSTIIFLNKCTKPFTKQSHQFIHHQPQLSFGTGAEMPHSAIASHQEADSQWTLARPKSKMERQKENFQWKQLPAKPLLGVRCVYIDGAILTISAALGVVCPDLKMSNVFEEKKTICSARGCETDNANANWGMAMPLYGIHGKPRNHIGNNVE